MIAVRTSEAGLALIREAEGLRLKAYRDGGGVWTIGYGHTLGVKRGQTITLAVAEQFLREDVQRAEHTIMRHVPGWARQAQPQEAWDALVSFVFNLGPQAFQNLRTTSPTGIARALERHDTFEVPKQMQRWVYDNGQRVDGLVNRRAKESALWLSGFVGASA